MVAWFQSTLWWVWSHGACEGPGRGWGWGDTSGLNGCLMPLWKGRRETFFSFLKELFVGVENWFLLPFCHCVLVALRGFREDSHRLETVVETTLPQGFLYNISLFEFWELYFSLSWCGCKPGKLYTLRRSFPALWLGGSPSFTVQARFLSRLRWLHAQPLLISKSLWKPLTWKALFWHFPQGLGRQRWGDLTLPGVVPRE